MPWYSPNGYLDRAERTHCLPHHTATEALARRALDVRSGRNRSNISRVGDIQTHLTCNVEQFSQRIKMRDDVDAAREVEHFANFDAIKQARAAGTALETLGYNATVTRRKVFHATLRVSKMATVDIETADRMVEEVFGVVTTHRGDYDGWGAPLIQ